MIPRYENNNSSLRDAGLWRVRERYVTIQVATAYSAYLYIVMLINNIIKVYKYWTNGSRSYLYTDTLNAQYKCRRTKEANNAELKLTFRSDQKDKKC